jgi:hypothetical protein
MASRQVKRQKKKKERGTSCEAELLRLSQCSKELAQHPFLRTSTPAPTGATDSVHKRLVEEVGRPEEPGLEGVLYPEDSSVQELFRPDDIELVMLYEGDGEYPEPHATMGAMEDAIRNAFEDERALLGWGGYRIDPTELVAAATPTTDELEKALENYRPVRQRLEDSYRAYLDARKQAKDHLEDYVGPVVSKVLNAWNQPRFALH